MQISRQKLKKLLAFSLFISVFSVCSPAFAEVAGANAKEAHEHAQSGQEFPGIYIGFLPCADCAGIKTTLALNKNGSYIMMTMHAGKSEREYVQKGKYVPGSVPNTITLTSKDGATTHHYLAEGDKLIQLDSQGNRISGKQAERYILTRNNITDHPPEHKGH
jgi:copper homeostasis protein (lipoprotein)